MNRRSSAASASRVRPFIVITCEHGGNEVPRRYKALFRGQARRLETHQGYDPGALSTGRLLSRRLDAPFFFSTTTRLLVDLNRTARAKTRFSSITRSLTQEEQEEILREHYQPHWDRVWAEVERGRDRGGLVLHIASHSFTPIWKGRVRRCDVGILFDPDRKPGAALARAWQLELQRSEPDAIVRRNYPYRGWTDAMTTEFCRRLPASQYIGIELEVNQGILKSPRRWPPLQRSIVDSLVEVVQRSPETR